MNIALAMLWTIFILACILFCTSLGTGLISQKTKAITNVEIDSFLKCAPPYNQLIDLTGAKQCFNGNFYIPSLNYIVSSNSTSFHGACLTACTNGINATNTGCAGSTEQQVFENCVSLTQPVDCNDPSVPIAHLGENYFYISSVGSC